MGNCVSKTKSKNTSNTSDTSGIKNNIENHIENSENKKSNSNLDINLHGYPPINFRKVKKSGFRIGAHVDIGFKDFEAGATFGRNSIQEINFSENNNHLKLLKSFENEDKNDTEKDKIIASLINLKNEHVEKPKPKNEDK